MDRRSLPSKEMRLRFIHQVKTIKKTSVSKCIGMGNITAYFDSHEKFMQMTSRKSGAKTLGTPGCEEPGESLEGARFLLQANRRAFVVSVIKRSQGQMGYLPFTATKMDFRDE